MFWKGFMEKLYKKSLNNVPLTRADARKLVSADSDDLLRYANKLRKHFKGDAVRLCSIINAKSGSCSENCRFCAQSSHNKTQVQTYPLVTGKTIKQAYGAAVAHGASCFGIVTSGNRMSGTDIDAICAASKGLRKDGMRASVSLGELDDAALRQLKNSGVKRYHHNLETSRRFFKNICTTHSYDDRVATVKRAKKAGFEVCCGGLFGLGETMADRLDLAFTLRELEVDSVPLNFLNPVPGTPLADAPRLSPHEILRTIALFRFILPEKDISVCGGREVNLRDMQSWIFYAGASGMMIGGYLTTPGRGVEQDLRMIKDAGLHPLRQSS
jgi:biotin synthase